MSTVSLKPELFGKFILLDKIAMGGMAEVYRAKAPGADGIGKIIAIKRILPQYSSHAEFIEMFKNEAKIAVNLTQANICQIYEFGEEHNQFYLTMEFIDGKNLRQVLSRCTKIQKSLTIEQCVYIVSQVASGLDYAHRCTDKNSAKPLNIIHRDMSPQNIMISYEGEVKVVDFGIAKAESKIESTRAGTLKGKFGYMSPEQAEGADLDARTDIFSTGIVLWELLTGERLFVANNEVNTIRKIRECQIPSIRKINPNIHEDLEKITNKALARDRSLRYQTAQELSRDLSRFLYKINPEFNPQDLSLFTKTIFKDDIIEDRKKVVEFANINFSQFASAQGGEKTQYVNDATKTTTYTETGAPNNLVLESANESIKSFDIKVDKGELVRKSLDTKQPQKIISQGSYNSIRSAVTQSKNKQSSFMGSFFTIAALALVGVGSFLFLTKPEKFFEIAAKVLNNKPTITNTQASKATQVPPPVETVRVFVNSFPAGAQITVNNLVVGTTPAEINLPLNKQSTLSLRRDGYLVYTKDFIASKNPDEFRATLQKANFGYLDIEVQPSTSDIYINGQKLAEKSPIKRYPVPADKPIRIIASNPYSNTQDQIQVTVRADTIKTIRLFPRKKK
ncbi:MAG: serine/threonine protein kinase [Oligoflexia bacterium]|nr:serine/threonine protein kinase [Oligoflexia bacterium]